MFSKTSKTAIIIKNKNMKKLEDFQNEKIALKSIFGGLADAGGTLIEQQCSCSEGHWHVDHTTRDK